MIWWLAFEKKPFQFGREIWLQVVVILLQLYIIFNCICYIFRYFITYHQWNSKPEFIFATHSTISYNDVLSQLKGKKPGQNNSNNHNNTHNLSIVSTYFNSNITLCGVPNKRIYGKFSTLCKIIKSWLATDLVNH